MRVEAVNSLGVAGATIEIPWRDLDGDEYLDLRENLGAIEHIAAAREHSPLAGFLAAVNGEGSIFTTARAKVWAENPPSASEGCSFHSRVELFFAHESFNSTAERYEEVVRRLVELWMRDTSGDTLAARLEILPCRYADAGQAGVALRIGFSARGTTPEQACTRWGLGLVRVQQALLFVSRAMRQKLGIDG